MSAEVLARELEYALPEALPDLDAGLAVARDVLRMLRAVWEEASGQRVEVLRQVHRVFGIDAACYAARLLVTEQPERHRFLYVEDCPLYHHYVDGCIRHGLSLLTADGYMGCVVRVLWEIVESNAGATYPLLKAVEQVLGAQAALDLSVVMFAVADGQLPGDGQASDAMEWQAI